MSTPVSYRHLSTLSARCAALCALLALLNALLLAPRAEALPPRSKQLSQTSTLSLDAEIPWVAGWDLEGRAVGLGDIMSRARRGFVFTLTKPNCLRCEDGLRYLLGAQDRLAKRGIQIIIVFLGDHRPEDIKSWLQSRGVGGSSKNAQWQDKKPIVLIDRYEVVAERLGTEGQLPRSFVVGQQGELLRIIAQEGYDLIELILSSVSGQADN